MRAAIAFTAVLAFAIVLLPRCDSDADSDGAPVVAVTETATPTSAPVCEMTTPTPAPDDVIWAAFVDWFTAGRTVDELMPGSEVVEGRITDVVLPYNPEAGFGGVAPDTPPPDDPKGALMATTTEEMINRPPARDFTVYSMEITDPGTTSLSVGDIIDVERSGGVYQGKTYRTETDGVLELGMTYVLTIDPEPLISQLVGRPAYSSGTPFSTFIVEDGKVHPLTNYWCWMPAVRELNGMSDAEVIAALAAGR